MDNKAAIKELAYLYDKIKDIRSKVAIDAGIIALEQEPFDEIIDKTVKEIFAQCKQTNPNYSKDWNEGFNDGMFHAITIIKGIRKGEIQ